MGTRRTGRVTVLFAEIRGFDRVAAATDAGKAGLAVERAAAAALDVLRSHGGIDVRRGGRAAGPVLTAEFEGEDRAARAVVASTAVRTAVPAVTGIAAAIGMDTGEVVEAAVDGGVPPVADRAERTVRTFAARLQEFAGPGQILLSASTAEELPPGVPLRPLGAVRTNPGGETEEAFCLDAGAWAPGGPARPARRAI